MQPLRNAPPPGVAPVPAPVELLDRDFVGFWQNSNPRFSTNWWVITEASASNYGVDEQTDTCIRGDAEIVGPATIRLTFGTGGTSRIELNAGPPAVPPARYEGRLVFLAENGGAALHHRIRRRDICFVDGQHLPGAPYSD